MENRRWLLWVGIAIGSILIFSLGGVVGVFAYREFSEKEAPLPATYHESVQTISGGAQILEVLKDSPSSGILVPGDIIQEVGGEPVSSDNTLADLIAGYVPRDTVELLIERAGRSEEIKVEVTLGENPDLPGHAYLGVRYRERSSLLMQIPGVEGGRSLVFPPGHLEDMLENYDELKDHMQFLNRCSDWRGEEAGVCGLVVAQVAQGSPAAEAGMQVGDLILMLNGEELSTREAFLEDIRAFEPGDSILLTLFRDADNPALELSIVLGEHPDEKDTAYLGVTVPGFFHQLGFGEWPPFNDMLPWQDRFSPQMQIILPEKPALTG
jgi:membrane-associated protease RseP (regulator of RpoE activity)